MSHYVAFNIRSMDRTWPGVVVEVTRPTGEVDRLQMAVGDEVRVAWPTFWELFKLKCAMVKHLFTSWLFETTAVNDCMEDFSGPEKWLD